MNPVIHVAIQDPEPLPRIASARAVSAIAPSPSACRPWRRCSRNRCRSGSCIAARAWLAFDQSSRRHSGAGGLRMGKHGCEHAERLQGLSLDLARVAAGGIRHRDRCLASVATPGSSAGGVPEAESFWELGRSGPNRVRSAPRVAPRRMGPLLLRSPTRPLF